MVFFLSMGDFSENAYKVHSFQVIKQSEMRGFCQINSDIVK